MVRTITEEMKLELLGVTGKESNTYSTWKNQDDELRKKIVNYPLDDFIIEWPRAKWNIDSYDGDDVKCVDGRNVKYFTRQEVDTMLKTQKEHNIAGDFNAPGLFLKQFGPLYKRIIWDNPYNNMEHYREYLTIIEKPFTFNSGVKGDLMSYIKEYEFIYTGSKAEFKLEYRGGYGTTAFLNFDENGNFSNREYNIPMLQFKQEKVDPADMYAKFKQDFCNLGVITLNQKRNRIFTDEFCYHPYFWNEQNESRFTLQGTKVQSPGVYKQYRHKLERFPKTGTTTTAAEYWDEFEEKYLTTIKHIFNA